MKPVNIVSAALLVSALLVALPGCEKPGPAEQVGESIDNSAEKTGYQLEKAGDAIKDGVQGGNN